MILVASVLVLLATATSGQDPTGDCIGKCLSSMLANVNLNAPSMCNQYKEGKICVLGCPNGDEIWKMSTDALPYTIGQLDTICANPDHQSFDLSTLVGADRDYQCVSDCESNLRPQADTIDGTCNGWNSFSGCVLNCSHGDVMLAEAREMVPDAFGIIDVFCTPQSMDTTEEADTTIPVDYVDGEALPDNLPFLGAENIPDVVGSPDHDMTPFCVADCLIYGLQNLNFSKSSLCQTYSDGGVCIQGCPYGAQLWSLAKELLPSTFDVFDQRCGVEDVLDSDKAAALESIAPCAQICKNIWTESDGDESPAALCTMYRDAQTCLNECPFADNAVDTLRNIFPDTMTLLDGSCNAVPITTVTDMVDESVSPVITGDNGGARLSTRPVLTCVTGCISTFADGIDMNDKVDICLRYSLYESCVADCPGDGWTLASNLFPDALNYLDSYCGLPDSVTDSPAIDPATMECAQQCPSVLVDMDPSVGGMCDSWTLFQSCVLGCPGGVDLMKQAQVKAPLTFEQMQVACQGSIDDSIPVALDSATETPVLDTSTILVDQNWGLDYDDSSSEEGDPADTEISESLLDFETDSTPSTSSTTPPTTPPVAESQNILSEMKEEGREVLEDIKDDWNKVKTEAEALAGGGSRSFGILYCFIALAWAVWQF